MGIADMQGPHVGYDIAPGSNFDLDTQIRQQRRHIGDGFFQRQIFPRNVRTDIGSGLQSQQRLGIGIQILDFLNHKLGSGLHDLLYCATFNRTQDAAAVYFRDVRWQLNLNLECLLIAVFRIDNIVL